MVKKIIFFLLIASVAFAGSYMIGNSTGESYADLEFAADTQLVVTGYFTSDSTFTCDSMICTFWAASASDSVAYGVYSCNAGDLDPDDLIDTTAQAQVTSAGSQITMKLDMINGATINAGDTVWLAIRLNKANTGSFYLYYNDASSGDSIRYNNVANAWPTTDWNPAGSVPDDEFRIQLWGTVVTGEAAAIKRVIFIGGD